MKTAMMFETREEAEAYTGNLVGGKKAWKVYFAAKRYAKSNSQIDGVEYSKSGFYIKSILPGSKRVICNS